MRAELIAVGTELLLGQIVNTNASFLAQRLAALGIDSVNQQVVGDNAARLRAAIDLAASRAELVVLIGGLGPTADDLSKQVLADYLGVALAVDEPALAKLTAYAEQWQRPMTPNNRVQAMYPAGATVLPNAVGLAVGAISRAAGKQYVLLPGPPKEFEPMVVTQLVPRLAHALAVHEVMASRVLRFFGIGESQLVTDLQDLIDGQTNPTLATYIKDYEVTLRLTAKAPTEAAAMALIAPIEAQVMARVGQYFYGTGDDNDLPQTVVAALAAHHCQLTAAESLTAGALQASLGSVAGVSEWFKGGFVTYANATKASMLGLDLATIDRDGAVSEATAKAMAQGALTQVGADLAVSLTGVAGPGPNDGQVAGTVWIGLAQRGQAPVASVHHFPGDRQAVRGRAVKAGLFTVLQALNAMTDE
ncbi:competence/damage-inducible protein A [Lacticaseibacillus daqingensis]|uniref:competence/damage-inducible protein A n=1 Tax=Lacticaseibacillus daqingensis TaxID=2486014 RepID=UPI000F784BAC|nr:competence/damage-inducible protein A [Lacticaseibacillus daqingensis]